MDAEDAHQFRALTALWLLLGPPPPAGFLPPAELGRLVAWVRRVSQALTEIPATTDLDSACVRIGDTIFRFRDTATTGQRWRAELERAAASAVIGEEDLEQLKSGVFRCLATSLNLISSYELLLKAAPRSELTDRLSDRRRDICALVAIIEGTEMDSAWTWPGLPQSIEAIADRLALSI